MAHKLQRLLSPRPFSIPTLHYLFTPTRLFSSGQSLPREPGSTAEIIAPPSPSSPNPTDTGEEEKRDEEKGNVDERNEEEDDGVYVNKETGEVGGPRGPEPTRYGDWERRGRCSDF